MLKLNIGGQQTISRFPSGWKCVDILPGADISCDISNMELPFNDSIVAAIYCSHTLEHILPWRLQFTLSEFYRVLQLGGRIRIVVPDMDIAIDSYVVERTKVGALDTYMRWWFDPTPDKEGKLYLNHVGGFNWLTLKQNLEIAGFRKIHRMCFGKFATIFDGCDNPNHASTSLYVESVKE